MKNQPALAIGDPVSLDRIKIAHIKGVLARSVNFQEAAATLDIEASTLWRLRNKHKELRHTFGGK